jgi:hypothetical protein
MARRPPGPVSRYLRDRFPALDNFYAVAGGVEMLYLFVRVQNSARDGALHFW